MRYVKWGLLISVLLLILGFFHYTLPQRDIVRVVNTEVRRVDFGSNSIFWANSDTGADGATVNRDVRFIETIDPDGNPIVYRNEDTGWGWPPYFKLDSSNLQAEARDLVSTSEAPKWVAVRHYGWRNEFLSIFPNAVGVKPVAGPDVRLFPWGNVVILSVMAIALIFVWRAWVQFRERTIDPLWDDAEDAMDAVDQKADQAKARARGLWSLVLGILGKGKG
jgi:hypothetical protein